MNNEDRLREIATLIHPCPIPNAVAGMDTCSHGAWPCRVTIAAWLAQGLDPDAERRRQAQEQTKSMILLEESF